MATVHRFSVEMLIDDDDQTDPEAQAQDMEELLNGKPPFSYAGYTEALRDMRDAGALIELTVKWEGTRHLQSAEDRRARRDFLAGRQQHVSGAGSRSAGS